MIVWIQSVRETLKSMSGLGVSDSCFWSRLCKITDQLHENHALVFKSLRVRRLFEAVTQKP